MAGVEENDGFVLLPPESNDTIGAIAVKVRSSMLLAADSVKENAGSVADTMKEKSGNMAESISENASLVKSKSIEVAGNVKEKSAEVAESMKKGAIAVAENVQGIFAPRTVKREGFLSRQINGKWTEFYFILKEGSIFVLAAKEAEKAEFSITLECVQRVEPLDPLVTGLPNCFRVSLLLREKVATVNNWSFFGVNFFTSNRVNNQEIDIILQAADEDELKGWVRELSSTSNGLALQEHLKKTGQSALKFAEATGVYSFVGTLTGLVGSRAGRRVADKIISP